MILVDSPNTLLVFSKRSTEESNPQGRERNKTPKSKKESKKKENHAADADADGDQADENRRAQVEHSSVYTIRPNQELGELIVDFVLIDKP